MKHSRLCLTRPIPSVSVKSNTPPILYEDADRWPAADKALQGALHGGRNGEDVLEIKGSCCWKLVGTLVDLHRGQGFSL
ncbi:hypothetical protein TNCT_732981 [Trichonephila clavata]|uniref:Uncharacterized protein n=1 Tax=Trichonephila clavata TaxID=2740835 RepID=A0A8X6GW34_TRICU|nr:hypothetical protein TNCT_732981 [Trichonephila clavata]